jgi:7-cyano-7-deazaguanine synthase
VIASAPAGGALVLFSGGQDSATCLADSLRRFSHVETIGFYYGQRHRIELDCRHRLRDEFASRFGGKLGPDHVLDISSAMNDLGATAMTSEMEIVTGRDNLPSTFVPGRNLLFFTYAASLAWRRDLRVLVGGMCETDFSGYPDCRDDTLKALQVALNLGLERRLVIETPLMWRTKAETFAIAEEMNVLDLIIEHTHTCYRGDRTRRHDWGYGCGTCPACELRSNGFLSYKAGRAG